MKRILITDDDQFLANVCRRKFEEAGFEVAIATDGNAAIEELVLHPPDVVLLDLMLPEIDGLGVLRFLRSRERLRGRQALSRVCRRRSLHRAALGTCVSSSHITRRS